VFIALRLNKVQVARLSPALGGAKGKSKDQNGPISETTGVILRNTEYMVIQN